MAQRCEICGKLSPTRSQRCECGYDFVTREVDAALDRAGLDSQKAISGIALGVGLLVAGAFGIALVFAYFAWRQAVYGQFLVFNASWPSYAGAFAGVLALTAALTGVVKIVKATAAQRNAARRSRTAQDRQRLPQARTLQ
jgi:hypothetical protein